METADTLAFVLLIIDNGLAAIAAWTLNIFYKKIH